MDLSGKYSGDFGLNPTNNIRTCLKIHFGIAETIFASGKAGARVGIYPGMRFILRISKIN
jgi:hypothetical protein